MVNIREMRKARKLSQSELGALVGITRQGLSKIETGNATPSVELAKALGEVLGFDWWLIYED